MSSGVSELGPVQVRACEGRRCGDAGQARRPVDQLAIWRILNRVGPNRQLSPVGTGSAPPLVLDRTSRSPPARTPVRLGVLAIARLVIGLHTGFHVGLHTVTLTQRRRASRHLGSSVYRDGYRAAFRLS